VAPGVCDGLIGADADGDLGVAELAMHLGLAPGALEAAVAEYVGSGIFALNLGTAAYVTPTLRTLRARQTGCLMPERLDALG